MELEELEKLKKELTEKITNREAVIVAYGDRMPKEKFQELADWKKELEKLNNKNSLDNQEQETEPESEIESNNKQDEGLNITINKKTGEVKIDDGKINKTFIMSSQLYKKKKLDVLRKHIASRVGVSDEDIKYMKNVDPTIYKAYFAYDKLSKKPKEESLSDEYVKTVIERSKAIEKGEEIKENSKLGNIKIDIGWHPTKENKRENKKEKFGLANLIPSFRANKILKKHGMSRFLGKKMDLATVKDNRKIFAGLAAFFAAAGTSAYLGLSSGDNKSSIDSAEKSIEQSTEQSTETKKLPNGLDDLKVILPKENEDTKKIQNEGQEQNQVQEKTEESGKIQFGEEISIEKYSLLYESSTSNESNGALTTDEKLGVNKIACEIDGKVFSSKDYSFDEIYSMAEKAGVDVKYHIDKIKTIDGKNYVNVNGTYVCNDNGTFRTENGEVWQGDVEYSSVAGWVNQKDVQKAENQKNNISDEMER